MTQVDFYILDQKARSNRYLLACRIAEKAWQQGNRVLIQTQSADESRHMDRLLWTYREQSFVPHALTPDADTDLNPVLINHADNAGDEHGVLINLAETVPAFFSRFDRVAECVDNDGGVREGGRSRFRFYRDHGYPLKTHNIN